MNDAVRKELYRQAYEAKQIEIAQGMTMADIRASTTLPLEPDDLLSPMNFSARLSGLNEKNSHVWLGWSSEYAKHVDDIVAHKALLNHVRRVALLTKYLDPKGTGKIDVSAALKFAAERGWPIPTKTKAEPPASPVVAVNASGGMEPDKAGPVPLTTGEIAFCFAGLHWRTESQWKKPLGNKPKWLAACIAIPGARGVNQTRWNPVFIGAALVRDGHAKPNSVRAKFQTIDLLKPWLEAWNTYEADNLATE